MLTPVLWILRLGENPSEFHNVAERVNRNQQQTLTAALRGKMIVDHDLVAPVVDKTLTRKPQGN